MARTREGATLTRTHHAAQQQIARGLARDIGELWALVELTNLSGTIGLFASAATGVVRDRGDQSALVGARYFAAFRAAEGVIGTASARRAGPAPAGVITRMIRGAAASGIVNARRRGFPAGAALRAGLSKATGSATTLTLNGGRDSIIGGIRGDRQALGWQRITGGNPCSFCAMVASRGAVFSADTADFEAHDHDQCEPEPFYRGSDPPAQNRAFREEWERATVGKSGTVALNAFRRAREGRPLPDDPVNR